MTRTTTISSPARLAVVVRRLGSLGLAGSLGLGVGALSCSDASPDEATCISACATAARCGLLPSALGGRIGLDRESNEADCIERCEASDLRDPLVEGLLEVLDRTNVPEDALCDVDDLGEPEPSRCEPLIEQLEEQSSTNALELTTTLTVRMNSAVSHVASGTLEPWCCFAYDPRLIEGVHDMFEPTAICMDRLVEYSICAAEAAKQTNEPVDVREARVRAACAEARALTPTLPEVPTAEAMCMEIRDTWMRPPPEQEGDPSTDPCHYARMSAWVQSRGIDAAAEACDESSLMATAMELAETRRTWHLEEDDLLRDAAGNVRDAEAIREALEADALDMLTRPMEFLHEACEDFDCSDPPAPATCPTGPSCSEADCIAQIPGCDASLCKAELSPPSRDCGFFGATEVALGYRDENGLEVFGDPIPCTSATVQTSFEGVRIGLVTPVAVVSGALAVESRTGSVAMNDEFSWFVTGEPRWVTAGTARLDIPSPLLEFRADELRNPLQLLGWVLPEFPLSQACDNQPVACEGYFNDNCEDGVDNDEDGFTDAAGVWCDPLMAELHERCVVVEPGGTPPRECKMDGAPQLPL